MNRRITNLMREAKQLARQWKPDTLILTGVPGAYTLIVQEWNGRPDSARDPERRKEYSFTTKEESKEFAAAVVQAYAERTGDRQLQPHLLDCSAPTDEEQKAAWREQGGTVLERMAEAEGVPLRDKVLEIHGAITPLWADVIRWRREDGLEG